MSSVRKVAIIGSGLIGRAWAIIFSSFGYRVQMFDNNAEYLSKVCELIHQELSKLCVNGLARGDLTLDERMALISTSSSLEDCLKGVVHVQENIFEDVQLKQDLFELVDNALEPDNVHASICSSSSVHLPSRIFSKVQKHKNQCLVAHPINPPLHVRLVELVPCPETRQEIIIRTRITMDEIGQKPVILNKEASGFALNRIQFAVFREAFRLVHDGLMSPDDVDTVVSEGLGPRYAFMGPWMTAHLNANGLADYFNRFGLGIHSVLEDLKPDLRLEGEASQTIIDAMTHQVPLDNLSEKRAWRDKCLVELAKIKDHTGPNSRS